MSDAPPPDRQEPVHRPSSDSTWGQPPSGPPSEPEPPPPPLRPPVPAAEQPPPTVGGPPYLRPSVATPALVLSIIGLACCGITAPIGLVLGAGDLRAIDRGLTDPSKRGTARSATILGAVGTFMLFGVVLLAVVFGATAMMSESIN